MPYKSALKGIIGRSFLAKLDVVASTLHLKIAYHDEKWALATINMDLQEKERIQRRIHEYILTSISKICDGFNLDAREREIRPTQTENSNSCN